MNQYSAGYRETADCMSKVLLQIYPIDHTGEYSRRVLDTWGGGGVEFY